MLCKNKNYNFVFFGGDYCEIELDLSVAATLSAVTLSAVTLSAATLSAPIFRALGLYFE